MKIQSLLLCSTLLCCIFISNAQQGFPENPSHIQEIPPSPTVWEFEKYGNYPVSMHTGLPTISIPLGSAKSGSLEVPVSIDYHASGIKVDQKASWVGLGWTLRAGGAITRTVRGANDEAMDGYINYPYQDNYDPALDAFKTERMLLGTIDTEPDVFSYDFMGYSGTFVFNNAEDQESATISLIPHTDLKVVPSFQGHSIVSFTITTPEGITVEFGEAEIASEYRSAGLIQDFTVTSASVWHLKKITSPNETDEITFEYKSIPTSSDPRISYSSTVNYPDPCNLNQKTFSGTLIRRNDVLYSQVKRLEKITFRNGYILFNSSPNNRLDDPTNEELRLDDVQIFNGTVGNSNLIKSFDFQYDYFGTFPSSGSNPDYHVRLKLTDVIEKGSNGAALPPYTFSYNDQAGVSGLPPRFSFKQDYWGYYNNKSNASLVPRHQTAHPNGQTFYLGDADRNPNPSFMDAGIIERITYPTAGYSIFEFESNTATVIEAGTPVQKIVGGLRVKSIKNYDLDNTFQWEKYYEYVQKDNPSLSSGVYNGIRFISTADFFSGKPYHFSQSGTVGSCPPGDAFLRAYQTSSIGVSSRPAVGNTFSTVYYSSVKEYNGNPASNEGYTWYHYETIKDQFYQGSGPVAFAINRSWARGQLLSQETYKNNDPNPIATIINTYETVDAETAIKGFKLGTRFNVQSLNYSPPNADPYSFRSIQYFITMYSERIPWKRMVSSTTTQDGVSTTQTYSYHPSIHHTNLSGTTTTMSNGKLMETKTYYPEDIVTASSLPEGGNLSSSEFLKIAQLKKGDLHRPATPIQTVTKEDGEVIFIKRNHYDSFGSSLLPSSEQYSKGGPLEQLVLYHEYDEDRPVHISRDRGMDVSYLWGYNKRYPVAQINNATYSEVLATGVNTAVLNNVFSSETAIKSELNKVRTGLPNALITTYTYDPLVGVTSVTDPRGYTMYYEYDEFNRLQYVRDADNNLISENQYHYKNQN